jgi:hypothetical protein
VTTTTKKKHHHRLDHVVEDVRNRRIKIASRYYSSRQRKMCSNGLREEEAVLEGHHDQDPRLQDVQEIVKHIVVVVVVVAEVAAVGFLQRKGLGVVVLVVAIRMPSFDVPRREGPFLKPEDYCAKVPTRTFLINMAGQLFIGQQRIRRVTVILFGY